MRCDWCYGRMFIDGMPCFHCVGGEVSCCEGETNACERSDGKVQERNATQRQQEGARGKEQTSSNRYNDERAERRDETWW